MSETLGIAPQRAHNTKNKEDKRKLPLPPCGHDLTRQAGLIITVGGDSPEGYRSVPEWAGYYDGPEVMEKHGHGGTRVGVETIECGWAPCHRPTPFFPRPPPLLLPPYNIFE